MTKPEEFVQAALDELEEERTFCGKCLVCGETVEPWEICGRCGWQEDGATGWSGANGEWLAEARRVWREREGN